MKIKNTKIGRFEIKWWHNSEIHGRYDGDPGCLMAIPMGLMFLLLAGMVAFIGVWG